MARGFLRENVRNKAWITGILSAALLCAGTGAAHADEVSPLSAIKSAAPEALSSVAPVTQGAGGDILKTQIAGASIQIPSDSSDPLVIKGAKTSPVSITLPFAAQADDAALEKPGVVSYDNGNDSQTVPAIKSDGKLQIATVIESSKSPRDYSYTISTPSGGSLFQTETGEVIVLDGNGAPAALVERPWAKDAKGRSVPTNYTVSGSSLVQHVDLSNPDIAYPVVADPKLGVAWWGEYVLLTKAETKSGQSKIAYGGAVGSLCGLIPPPGNVGCGVVVAIKTTQTVNVFNSAVAQGKCAELNMPFGTGPVLWTFSVEKCER